jgi:hypothetical protein
MAIRITCIIKDHGNHDNPHKAVEAYGWVNEEAGTSGRSLRVEAALWVKSGGKAYVIDSKDNKVYCEYRNREGTEFLQTVADGRETNNLLELPECE